MAPDVAAKRLIKTAGHSPVAEALEKHSTKGMSMSTMKEELIDWLRDAYAMEKGLEVTLKKQAENSRQLPIVRERASQHLTETQRHAEIVKSCLQSLGSDVSTIKTGIAQMLEMGMGMGTKFASDERVKDMLAGYASEHFELACYQALRAGAEAAGQTEIVAACDQIIPDEENMAEWLRNSLPEIVKEYLASSARA